MRNDWWYIWDSGDFIEKIKKIGKIPKDSFLVTADVVRLYPSIPYNKGSSALKQKELSSLLHMPVPI